MRPKITFCAIVLGAGVLGAVALSVAAAQDWPSHPIKVISPFIGGTTNDLVARIVLDPVAQQIGQPLSIENRPGGDGTTGVAAVVHADPDGYTLLLASSSLTAATILHKSLPYDVLRDLTPVAMFGGQAAVLAAAPSKGYKTLADLVAAAKAKPGTLKFASVGIGSASHIAGERFRLLAGIDVQHVPYSGPVQALDDLQAGRVDFYFVPIAPAVPLVAQGRVVALAVSTLNRSLSLPGVPTLTQAGYAMPEYLVWDGVMAPAKTPPAIVGKLGDAVQKALGIPQVRDKLQRFGTEAKWLGPDDFSKFFDDDVAAMLKLGKDANIAPIH